MAKVSAKYETVFIINSELGEEAIAELVAKFKTLVEENGTLVELEEMGKRKLAYEINYKSEGYYVLINFKAESDLPNELERVLRITDGVVRFIVLKK